MLNLAGERTLISAIVPPGTSHINAVIGLSFNHLYMLTIASGIWSTLVYDFFIKILGKSNLYTDNANQIPFVKNSHYHSRIALRALLLNCLTLYYGDLWKSCWDDNYCLDHWSKRDPRLDPDNFSRLTRDWDSSYPLRSDYSRRQALVELDVLVAKSLGMSLEQLKTIYRIQFPVLQQYERDTWYDANGRIVFTTNRSLTGVGYDRKTWESEVKGAPAGQKFYQCIEDDTLPGGVVKRTIEYVAPFERCDRERDYEVAWSVF
jgi:hypothetical protein